MTTAPYVREPELTVSDLRTKLEELAVLSISVANPGIDLDEVKRGRAEKGLSWTATAE